MNNNLIKFKALLAELFQLNQADLDFGIYRIMNQKRDEITRFMDEDLMPQVNKELNKYQSADKALIQKELDKAIASANDLGMDPEQSPKVKELRESLGISVDIAGIENEVFSHLYNFFRRYYNEGDFLSLRRYKKGVYAIPYEGEEVKLHWANHDQYYIKSSDTLKNFAFKTASGRVNFKVVEADTEKDNTKAVNGNERRFILCQEKSAEINGQELNIFFEHGPDPEKRTQKVLNEQAVKTILSLKGLGQWIFELGERVPTEKNPDRTLLEKRLNTYTAKNTFDYFIHKDLGRFLRRELDFYIKNEIMHLDDIDQETVPKVEQYLSKIRVVRGIAHKIIAFIEQLENFQKKMWLKKKFVVETNYCITLDRVPEELLTEIAANKEQRKEWVKLFAIDEISGLQDGPLFKGQAVKYTEPLTVEFLKANNKMVLDTRFFSDDFKMRLIASIDDFDEQCDGLLIHSENFQALKFIENTFVDRIGAIYIDPPYNTSGSEIAYKNEYKHSSWLSLVQNRLYAAKNFMKNSAIHCTTIDDAEAPYLHILLDRIFDSSHYLATVPIRSKPQGRAVPSGFSPNHEYAIFYGASQASVVGRLPRDKKKLARYAENDEEGIFAWANFRGTGANSWRENRPKLYYPIYVSPSGEILIPNFVWDASDNKWKPESEPPKHAVVYPTDSEGVERVWTMGWERAQKEIGGLLEARKSGNNWQIYRKYRPNQEGALPGTWWDNPKYSASESGTKVVKEVFGGNGDFSYPKSVYAVEDCLRACGINTNSIILDYFAGSGTTGHAVIKLNREDNGNRKYILVEMGDYFNTVLKPRIQKVVYSKDWKDGNPQNRDTGVSHCFKYIRLESYEDTLNNLSLDRTSQQQEALDFSQSMREDYTLSYLLDVETRDSLMDLSMFERPFDMKLKIATGTVGETRSTKVDMVETFNYLIGLTVKHIETVRGVRVVEGTSPKNEKVLVLWRTLPEMDSNALDAWFTKQKYSTKDLEYDLIYVNGDNNLENLKKPDQTWKVRLIDQEFLRLMFDVTDI